MSVTRSELAAIKSAVEWAKLQVAEWERMRDTTRDAGAWTYYCTAARHLRTLIDASAAVSGGERNETT